MVTVIQQGKSPVFFEADPNCSLLALLHRQGIFLDAPCGGNKKCGKCKVIVSGQVSSITKEEANLLTSQELGQGVRLACCTFPRGEVTLRLFSGDGVEVQTQGFSAGYDLCPSVVLTPLTVEKPSLQNQSPDIQRLMAAWKESGREERLSFSLTARRAAPRALSSGQEVQLVLWDSGLGHLQVLDLLPSGPQSLLGMAVDIGTTTVVAYYYDLTTGALLDTQSALNPQRAFGADVISRIGAAKEPQGLAQQTQVIFSLLQGMTSAFARNTGLNPDRLYHIAIAANTTMLHLLCGLDPSGIAAAPFVSADLMGWDLPAARLGLGFGCPDGKVALLPCISSYVGADITAGMVSCGLEQAGEKTVYLDVGTNGEMAYRGKEGLLCCSTAAGPAFEGAHIHCGAGGIPGAVSRVWLEDEELRYETIGGQPAVGLCGSGLIDAVAVLLQIGAVDETGRLLDEDEMEAPWSDRLDEEGNFLLVPEQGILLTQQDLREVQLAKAAICAGIDTLLHASGETAETLSRILIAGGFGAHIDPDSAVTIGLLPPEAKGKVQTIGNAAGAGAAAALLSRQVLSRMQALPAQCRYLELSGDAFFQEAYVERMMFDFAQC